MHRDYQTVYVEIEKGGMFYAAGVQYELVSEGSHPFGTTKKLNPEIVGEVKVYDEDGETHDYHGNVDEELIEKALSKF